MEFTKFTSRMAGTRAENRWLRWIALGLLGANLILVFGVLSTRMS